MTVGTLVTSYTNINMKDTRVLQIKSKVTHTRYRALVNQNVESRLFSHTAISIMVS